MTRQMSHSKIITSIADIDDLALKLRYNLLRGILTTVEIKSETESKTLKQLGYLFGVVIKNIRQHEMENGNALSKDDVKEWIKNNFFYDEVVIQGVISHNSKSIGDASKEQISGLIENVVNWCINNGIDVPPPPDKE